MIRMLDIQTLKWDRRVIATSSASPIHGDSFDFADSSDEGMDLFGDTSLIQEMGLKPPGELVVKNTRKDVGRAKF